MRRTTLAVPSAALGPESPLPRFAPVRALPDAAVGPGAPAEMLERVRYGRLASPLPYRIQEDYDRELRDAEVPAYVLDNDLLRATVLPTLGGRVWSLYDVARGRELVFRNPVVRFANFGLTNAWCAGGIEWNLGSTGHTTLSARPMHAAVLRGPAGEVLRLWEWERTRDLVLQVDLSLPAGSDRLFASTRVINPDPEDKPLYYWTNIAVPETSGTRVLVTADTAWRTDYAGALSRVAVPHPDSEHVDVSYPMASTPAADYFYDVEDQHGRHIVSVEPDGRGFAQTSTRALRGRKLFCWGCGMGGARWQEWLCGPQARYAEIQAGWCPTQLEHDRLPGGAAVSWTEAFGGVDLDPASFATGYAEACAAARSAVHAATGPQELEDRHHRWLAEVADAPVTEQLSTGSGWGYAELLLRGGSSIVPAEALPFARVDDDSLPARLVLEDGSEDGLEDGSESFAAAADRLPVPPVSDRWRAVIDAAPDGEWVHLARAVNAHARGELDRASAEYAASVTAHENAWALRGLAVLEAARGRGETAADLYTRARTLQPHCRGLVTEELGLLLDIGRPEACLAVVALLPPALRRHGRTRLLEARALMAAGERDHASAIVDELSVEDLAEGETVLSELWHALHPGSSVPAHLDFAMTEE